MLANTEFYFVHGWGCDNRIWQNWRSLLKPDVPAYKFNRGYFNEKQPLLSVGRSTLSKTLIAHSFGLHLIPTQLFNEIDLLVLISSFRYFHDHSANQKLSKKRVNLMKQKLLANTHDLLDDFYLNCGFETLSATHRTETNAQLLYDDLMLLDENQINLESLQQIPKILLLHGADDKIVDLEHSKRLNQLLTNSKLLINKTAQHALPATDAQWCIDAILDHQPLNRNAFNAQIFPGYADISANFSRKAQSYEQSADIQKIAAERLSSRIAKQAKIPADGTILEIGCGTGLLSEHLIETFSDHNISFIDPAANMLKCCYQKLSKKLIQEQETFSKNYKFIESTIEDYLDDPTYAEDRPALVASSFALHWLLDLKSVLTRLLEKIPAGGQIFFSFPLFGSFPEWQDICDKLNIAFTGNQLPLLEEILQVVSSAEAEIDYEEYSCQLHFNSALQFFQEMKMLGASTNKPLASVCSKSAHRHDTRLSNFRSLIKTWDNQKQKTLGNGNSQIISTYKLLEGTITRR